MSVLAEIADLVRRAERGTEELARENERLKQENAQLRDEAHRLRSRLTEQPLKARPMHSVCVVLAPLPGTAGLRYVCQENDRGHVIDFGKWERGSDGLRRLRIPIHTPCHCALLSPPVKCDTCTPLCDKGHENCAKQHRDPCTRAQPAAWPTPIRYRVLRSDRGAQGCPPVGSTVYPGNDNYGCASEDTRYHGIKYVACSVNPSGEPFFTIPAADVMKIGAES